MKTIEEATQKFAPLMKYLDREYLEREIQRCRSAQSWANATRSLWLPEVVEVLDALDAGDSERLATAIADAIRESYRLAEIIARAGFESAAVDILDSLWNQFEYDPGDYNMPLPDVIKVAKELGCERYDYSGDGRDGMVFNDAEAVFYATCRGLADDDQRWVSIDLVTEEVSYE